MNKEKELTGYRLFSNTIMNTRNINCYLKGEVMDFKIYTSDIISIFALIISMTGGLFAFVQWKSNNRLKRAEFIRDLNP